jgi:phosphatidylethanolamine/phosphatidyl-N-methylethanolamine N-methyltransferase
MTSGAGDLDKTAVSKAYARWAPIYDFVFGKVFDPGRQAAILAAEDFGGRILEVGVGTGISLPDNRRARSVIGVDFCEPMLRKASHRVQAMDLAHVDGLAVMDAAHLAFADSSFDVVVGQFLITAVPNPEATLDEFVRVVRPEGEIVLVNHIGAEAGPRRLFENCFAPIGRRLGWRPEFRWGRIARWAEGHGGVELVERRSVQPLGHFSLIRFRKRNGLESPGTLSGNPRTSGALAEGAVP